MPVIPPAAAGLTSRIDQQRGAILVPTGAKFSSFGLFGLAAGLYGGDVAVSAMAYAPLLIPFRWLGGWFNNPGSYEAAKLYSQITESPFWAGLFPSKKISPATLFELDGKVGPLRSLGLHSSASPLSTGHLAYLLYCKVQMIKVTNLSPAKHSGTPVHVTVIHLQDDSDIPSSCDAPLPALPDSAHGLFRTHTLSIIPIISSVTCCIFCALVADWWCFTSITFGMVANGVTRVVIGSGKLSVRQPASTSSSRTPEGILWSDDEVVVLLGPSNALSLFTHGRFSLQFSDDPERRQIGWCSILLIAQFFIQILLVPQGSLIGQIMFIASLYASLCYNSYISSLDKDTLQFAALLQLVPSLAHAFAKHPIKTKRFRLSSWRSAVVLALLHLQKNQRDRIPRKVIDELVPDDTPVWQEWKKRVMRSVAGDREYNDPLDAFGDFQPSRKVRKVLLGWLDDVEDVLEGWRAMEKAQVVPAPASAPDGPETLAHATTAAASDATVAANASATPAASNVPAAPAASSATNTDVGMKRRQSIYRPSLRRDDETIKCPL